MSVEALGWALHVPVGGNAKVILLGLANHAHPDGSNARPMVETLAGYAHCDRRSVQRNLRKLEQQGWIRQTGVHLVGGRSDRAVAVYQLALGAGRQNAAPSDGGATPTAARGDAGDANGATLAPPEPSKGTVKGTVEAARASASDSLPDDFPEELKPHARIVFRVLREVAREHGLPDVKVRQVGRLMQPRQRKPWVKEVHDFAGWAANPPRPIKNVVSSFTTWIDRERDLAGIERLPDESSGGGDGSPRKRFVRHGGNASGNEAA